MTLANPEKTWTVCYKIPSMNHLMWEFFYDEDGAQYRYNELTLAGFSHVTKRPYLPSDSEHLTQEQAELLHAAADGAHELTKSTEPDYFPGKPTNDQVLVMRARIAAGCAWRGVRDTPDQEPEVRQILRDCATRLEVHVAEAELARQLRSPSGRRAQRARAAYETYQRAVWDPHPIHTFESREPRIQEIWARVVDAILEVMGADVDPNCGASPLTNKRAKAAHDAYVVEQGGDHSWAQADTTEREIWVKTVAAALR